MSRTSGRTVLSDASVGAPPPPAPPRRRGWRRAAPWLATAFGLGLGLVLSEGLAAFFLPAPLPERWPPCSVMPDPDLGWRMVPHDVHYTYAHPVRLDALGLRNPPRPHRHPDEYRILVLGDSEVYGQGVGDEAVFTARLEQLLNARDGTGHPGRFTVINAGVRAYATDQELAFLEKTGVRLRPHLVLLCVYVNDFEPTDIAAVHRRSVAINGGGPYLFDLRRPAGPGARLLWEGVQLLRRSRVIMTVHDVLMARRARDGYEMRLVAGIVDDDIRHRIARFERELGRFLRSLAEARASGVVVVIPAPEQVRSPALPPRYQELVAAAASRVGVPVIDLLPAFRARFADRVPVLPYDPHYDPAGHALIAETLAERLPVLVPGLLQAPTP